MSKTNKQTKLHLWPLLSAGFNVSNEHN